MNPLDVVRMLLDVVLRLVPLAVAQDELTEAGRRRANAIADAAEDAKFGLVTR